MVTSLEDLKQDKINLELNIFRLIEEFEKKYEGARVEGFTIKRTQFQPCGPVEMFSLRINLDIK